jgi:hypothetical protein
VESTIKATHLNYEKTGTEDLAVIRAQTTNPPVTNSNYGADSNTVLAYKRIMGPAPNSSADLFVSQGIEIVGTATKNGIKESNTQGYNVFPFPARNL